MSSRIDLTALHTRVTCIQAECALWQIRRQWEHLLATTTDEGRRMQIAELLREGRCPPDRVIRGYHGYFVGCMGGDSQPNTVLIRDHIHAMGGMKHEIALHEHESNHDVYASKHGEQAYNAEHQRLEGLAQKGAGKLSDSQRAVMQEHADRLNAQILRMGNLVKRELANNPNARTTDRFGKIMQEMRLRSAEAQMLDRQMKRADAAKPEDIHAVAAQRQKEQGLKAEVQPGTRLELNTEAFGKGKSLEAISLNEILDVVGPHQLGAALSSYTVATLKQMAAKEGIDVEGVGNNRAALVSRITSQMTQGRYSANFAKSANASTAKSTGGRQSKASDEKPSTSGKKIAPVHAVPLTENGQYAVGANDEPDPFTIHRMYGNLQYRQVLDGYTLATLKKYAGMAQSRYGDAGPKSMNNRKDVIDYLVKTVPEHEGWKGPKTQDELDKLTGKSPSTPKASGGRTGGAKSERESLDDLHAKARATRAKEGLPDEVKPEDLPTTKSGRLIFPTQGVDMSKVGDVTGGATIQQLAQLYEERYLGATLTERSMTSLQIFAKQAGIENPGQYRSKSELISRIMAEVTRDHQTGMPRYSADFGVKAKSASTKKSSGERTPRTPSDRTSHKTAKLRLIATSAELKDAQTATGFNATDKPTMNDLRFKLLAYGTQQLPTALGELTMDSLRSIVSDVRARMPGAEDSFGRAPHTNSKSDMIDFLVQAASAQDGKIATREDVINALNKLPWSETNAKGAG